jgi:hypothetical protein
MGHTTGNSQPKAIIHPWIDALCVGGLSIAFITYLLVAEPGWNSRDVAEEFIVLAALVNWPHFMATYRLLYGSPATVRRYPWSTIWMPLGLAVYCLVAIVAAPYTQVPLDLAVFVAGAYLAWHYTGQTWGMMATFSFLGGAPFEEREKLLIRTSLRILLAWHVFWFVFHTGTFELGSLLDPYYANVYRPVSIALITVGSAVGLWGMWRYTRRIERIPPIRVVIPLTSIWLWYALLAIYPFAIFWVQISHALQYLLFPARVETNRRRMEAKERGEPPRRAFQWKQALLYGISLVAAGVVLFEGLPRLMAMGAPLLNIESSLTYTKAAIAAFINIHHYFADGAIWKLSNPAVRKELFAHLKE